MKDKNIVVWFSNGVASAIAAIEAIKDYGDDNNVMIVNNPIMEEHPDNLRFKNEISNYLGVEIIEAKNKNFPSCSCYEVWEKRKYMSGVIGAPCTTLLKKEARYQFEKDHHIDYHILGFTYDEAHRHHRFVMRERSNSLGILVHKQITKGRCFEMLNEIGIKRPKIYDLLYPNANCIGCVKAQSPTYWNMVRKDFPEVFNCRADQSRRIGCKLVKYKGKRIFLDELPVNAKGGKIKSYECGIFCDNY